MEGPGTCCPTDLLGDSITILLNLFTDSETEAQKETPKCSKSTKQDGRHEQGLALDRLLILILVPSGPVNPNSCFSGFNKIPDLKQLEKGVVLAHSVRAQSIVVGNAW